MQQKLYSLLIVDDEALIRSAIAGIIDWQSLGFSDIYEAEDGNEALSVCRMQKIDLVLTDIVMPFMDGLELSRILKREFPEIHIVILTGHEDFEYAKQSIHYGVKNYILKPIGAKSLYKEMEEICQSLHMDKTQKQYISRMKRRLHESIPALREKFLYSLVCTSWHYQRENEQRIQMLEIPLHSKQYIVGIVEADMSSVETEDMELFLFIVKNICFDTVGNQHYAFDDNYRTVIIYSLDQYGDDWYNIVYDTMEVIIKAIQNTLKIQSVGALGSAVGEIKDLHQSYREADTALECRYRLGYDQVFDISDLDYVEKVFLYPDEEIKQFIYSMKFLTPEEIKVSMERINQICMHNRALSITNIKMIFFELLNAIFKELSAIADVKQELWEQGLALYQSMSRKYTIKQFKKGLLAFAFQVSEVLQEVQSSSSQKLVHSAQEFINQNYMNTELSLSVVAEHVGVSTGYLSGLFKRETNMHFVEYLTHLRMERAMEMICRTDKKNYEIAEETGFSNPHYFSISFKKYSGMSPSEYRIHLKTGNS